MSADAEPALDAGRVPDGSFSPDARLPDVNVPPPDVQPPDVSLDAVVPPSDAATPPTDAGVYCSPIQADLPDVLAPNDEAGAGNRFRCDDHCPYGDLCLADPRRIPGADADLPKRGYCVIVTSVCFTAERWVVPSGARTKVSVNGTFYDRYTGAFESGEISKQTPAPETLSWSMQNGTGSAIGLTTIYDSRFWILGESVGAVTIKGTYGSVTTEMQMTIAPAAVVRIDPVIPSLLEPGRTYSLGAIGYKSNQATVDLNADVTWTSSDPSVLQVDSTNHKVTALKAGPVTLSTVYAGNPFTATRTVNPKPFTSLSIALSGNVFNVGDVSVFEVNASDEDGAGGWVNDQITVSTSAPNVAQLFDDPQAFDDPVTKTVLFIGPGQVSITAALGTLSTSRVFDVDGTSHPSVTELLAIEPANAMVPEGRVQFFNLRANFSDGTSGNATAHWTSADPAVFGRDENWNGIGPDFLAGAAGTTTLTATHGPYTITTSATSVRDSVDPDAH